MYYNILLFFLCLTGAIIVKIMFDYFPVFKGLEIDWVLTITCGIVAYLLISKFLKRE